MNTDKSMEDEHQERDPITHDIIGAAFEVYRVVGDGFLDQANGLLVNLCSSVLICGYTRSGLSKTSVARDAPYWLEANPLFQIAK